MTDICFASPYLLCRLLSSLRWLCSVSSSTVYAACTNTISEHIESIYDSDHEIDANNAQVLDHATLLALYTTRNLRIYDDLLSSQILVFLSQQISYDDCMTIILLSQIMRGKPCSMTNAWYFIIIFYDDRIKKSSLNVLRPSQAHVLSRLLMDQI